MASTASQATIENAEEKQKARGQLLQMATGYMLSAAVYTAAKLKIADLLANGPRPVEELAAESGSHAGALYRVLRSLAAVGIFAEVGRRRFALTPPAEGLRSDLPDSHRDLVLWVGNRFHWHVWAEMPYSVETGTPAVEKVYGKKCFECFETMPEVGADFNAGMTCLSAHIAPAVLEAYDFSGIGTLMDVAGGHGFVLCEVLRAYPEMKGILFDVESVIEGAKCRLCDLRMDHRCQTVAGNFFEHIPGGADAYYLQHIIHDWEDAKALKILENCREALAGRKGGRLLVADCVLKEGNDFHFGKLLDLEMLLMPGGYERTEPEFRELFAAAGFEITKIVPTRAAESMIEAQLR